MVRFAATRFIRNSAGPPREIHMARETRSAQCASSRTGESRMKRKQTYGFWRSAAQYLLGSSAVVLLTFVCFRLQAHPVLAALLCLIVIVLLSAAGGFVPSIFVSIIGVLCLEYLLRAADFLFTGVRPGGRCGFDRLLNNCSGQQGVMPERGSGRSKNYLKIGPATSST